MMDISNLRFLVVEDHAFQRWMLDRMLSQLGAKHVVTATDGRMALDIVRSGGAPIDIILSDLDMPGMDGMEFIRHVGEVRSGASVILTSALDRTLVDSAGTMTETYGVILLGAIEKPVTVEKLSAALEFHSSATPYASADMAAFSLDEILAAVDRGEMEAYLQPKVDLLTNRVCGAEALARWRHPSKGIIGPGSFIGALERSGQMRALTLLMIEQSMEALRSLRGMECSISVNVSPVLFAEHEFANQIVEMAREQDIDPRDFVLEVTESAVAGNLGASLENLARLRMKGFGLSIDDFGTGYSSMQQLVRIPFTELKIDQAFVKAAPERRVRQAMLESSLLVARKLGLASVAEGVETPSEWRLLAELGCDAAQGFLIARPMEARRFLAWVEERRSNPPS